MTVFDTPGPRDADASKNQIGLENKSCPKFDFTSPKILKIFFSGQIFLILKFEIFELKYFLRP